MNIVNIISQKEEFSRELGKCTFTNMRVVGKEVLIPLSLYISLDSFMVNLAILIKDIS